MAEYTYDSWGNIISATGELAQLNPFRYRGYYYDEETGFYYLQSRYYDAGIGRFVNADGDVADVGGNALGHNQFAYCFNNPINMSDSDGNWPKWISNTVKSVKKGVKKVAAKTKSVAYSVYYNATKWHFEDRAEKNGKHPSHSDVTAKNSGWTLLPKSESEFHDNGIGKPEEKYITNDGREAVFDGDTLEIVTDPRYIATYNYIPLYKVPQNGANILDYVKSGTSYIGHGIVDVAPYWITGYSNTREQFEQKIFIFD